MPFLSKLTVDSHYEIDDVYDSCFMILIYKSKTIHTNTDPEIFTLGHTYDIL